MMAGDVAAEKRSRIITDLTMGDMDRKGAVFPANMKGIEMYDEGLTAEQLLKNAKNSNFKILSNAAQPEQAEPQILIYFGTPPESFVYRNPGLETTKDGGRILMDHDDPSGAFLDKIGRAVKYGGLYLLFNSIPDPPDGHILRPWKKMLEIYGRQGLISTATKDFPTIAKYYGFSQGFSDVQSYYTVQFVKEGAPGENPLYINSPKGTGGREVPAESFGEWVVQSLENPQSSDARNKTILKKSFNEIAGQTRADFQYLNGDLRSALDAGDFRYGLAKRDLKLMQQNGPMRVVAELNPMELPEGITEARIVEYGRPDPLTFLGYNFIGDQGYNVLDNVIFNPLGPYMPKDKISQQVFTLEEFTINEAVTEGLWALAKRMRMSHYT